MPRPARAHITEGITHVLSRGVDRQPVFLADQDYDDFRCLLAEAKIRFSVSVYAYCLMPTHFHLLVETTGIALSRMTQWLLTCHAKRFNWRHNRTGHLFGDRNKSIRCASDSYFLELLRYINLNPVRAGLVARPEDWRWSGHNELLGVSLGGIIDCGLPLSVFHNDPIQARNAYRGFMLAGMASHHQEPSPTAESNDPPLTAPRAGETTPNQAAVDDPTGILCGLTDRLFKESGISLADLRGPTRAHRVAHARTLIAQHALDRGVAPSKIASFLNRTASFISKTGKRKRGAQLVKLVNV